MPGSFACCFRVLLETAGRDLLLHDFPADYPALDPGRELVEMRRADLAGLIPLSIDEDRFVQERTIAEHGMHNGQLAAILALDRIGSPESLRHLLHFAKGLEGCGCEAGPVQGATACRQAGRGSPALSLGA